MKILHILLSPRAEGTPRLVLDWLAIDNKHVHEMLFLSPEGELKSEFQSYETDQFYNSEFILKFTNIFKIIRLVRQRCAARKPDLVIIWLMGFSPWITIGCRLAGIKNILVHNGNPPGTTFMARYVHTYICFLIGKIMRNKIIACSYYVKNEFNKIPFISLIPVHVVYNSFRAENFIPKDTIEYRKDISMIAYMEKARDYKSLLMAWKKTEELLPDAKLNLVGDGVLKADLESFSKQLNLKNVFFAGRVTDVKSYYWKTRVYVFSTLNEGFGITLLESLASCCKVVATDVPACREILQNGKYGILVEPGNPIALSKAIFDSYQNTLSEQEIKSQIQYTSEFSPKKMLDGYLAVANVLCD